MTAPKTLSAFWAPAALFFSAALLALPAQAFDYGYRADNYFYTYQIDNVVQRNTWENQEKYKKTYGKAKSNPSASAPKSTSADRYAHSNRVSQQINEQMLQTLRQDLQSKNQLTPQAEQQIKQLGNANLIGQVKQALKSDGYQPDSVAVAMAYWVLINYGIAQQADLAKLKGHGLVRQLQAAMSDGDWTSASQADKQRMAETLYWMGSLQMAMYLEAVQQNDRQAIATRISDAQSALSHMGLSVRHIRQGSQGLELR